MSTYVPRGYHRAKDDITSWGCWILSDHSI